MDGGLIVRGGSSKNMVKHVSEEVLICKGEGREKVGIVYKSVGK
jgi:hypothetical protein